MNIKLKVQVKCFATEKYSTNISCYISSTKVEIFTLERFRCELKPSVSLEY